MRAVKITLDSLSPLRNVQKNYTVILNSLNPKVINFNRLGSDHSNLLNRIVHMYTGKTMKVIIFDTRKYIGHLSHSCLGPL